MGRSFKPTVQLAAGEDGVAYRAEGDGEVVELRHVGAARAIPARWAELTAHVTRARLAKHTNLLALVDDELDGDLPWIALEWTDRGLDDLLPRLRLSEHEALAHVHRLAGAFVEAHRMGVFHGALTPAAIRVRADGSYVIDLWGLRTGSRRARGEGDETFSAPEREEGAPGPATDIFSLGALLVRLTTPQAQSADVAALDPGGATVIQPEESRAVQGSGLDELVAAMLHLDPLARPSAVEVQERIVALMAASEAAGPPTSLERPISASGLGSTHPGTRVLGRFQLFELLGEGGMGRVHRGVDLADGAEVAVKILSDEQARSTVGLRRFRKEGRLLAELDSPYVARFIELNEDRGTHYLVMEYVAGKSLRARLKESGPLEERAALQLMCDVARGLADAHDLGIVHRDIKPSNILFASEAVPDVSDRVKLCDFGLARHVDEHESLAMTKAGAFMGTPFYMSPEQCTGTAVDSRSDVYSIGATLFETLVGKPPFQADSTVALIAKQLREPAPPLQKLRPEVSDACADLVARSLEKEPNRRPSSARELLEDMERMLRGDAAHIELHPKLPTTGTKVLTYSFQWDLDSSATDLWPYVSNTERINRAIGLGGVEYTRRVTDAGIEVYGRLRVSGIEMYWREHPFEWIESRRMGVLREYSAGPLRWFHSITQLDPRPGGGTRLTHVVKVEPNGIVGRAAAAIEIGQKGRRALDRVYKRIDKVLRARAEERSTSSSASGPRLGAAVAMDPFETPEQLASDRHARIEDLQDKLLAAGVDPNVAECLTDYLAEGPSQELARIRPIAFARRFALPEAEVLKACLHAAKAGGLTLLWDLLCPICRVSASIVETMRALEGHAHCPACNLDYELDFSNLVELVFRVHPEIREVETQTYCVGGPVHSPHVVAQLRLGPGERFDMDLSLRDGVYRMGGRQLPVSLVFRVLPAARASRWDLPLRRGLDPSLQKSLRSGRQRIVVENDFQTEIVLRLERAVEREDALTAARAAAIPLFRQLFPHELVSPGHAVSVSRVTLLATELASADHLHRELGEERAFALLHEHLRALQERIEVEGGAVVKVHGDGVVAAFTEPVDAVRAALSLERQLVKQPLSGGLPLRVSVCSGAAMVATINERLDYFGRPARLLLRALELAAARQVVISETTITDARVRALLARLGVRGESVRGPDDEPLLRFDTHSGASIPPAEPASRTEPPVAAASTGARGAA